MTQPHTPVLLKEVFECLSVKENDTYLDATLGMGGHSEEVWRRFGKLVTIAGIDADIDAVEAAKSRLEIAGANPKFTNCNFRNLDKAVAILDIKPNKILFDLGWNKSQFDTPEGKIGRGFSFQKDEPLNMAFDKNSNDSNFNAYTIVNEWDEENLKTIIESYGEEGFAWKIAKAIVQSRQSKKIETTAELVQIIKKATPIWYHFKRIHPATKTFQAIRIAVNDELRALEEGLSKAFDIISSGGRVAVISFHSLEDRIVKRFFKKLDEEGKAKVITKKPIEATEDEVVTNPRSRSAKLRAIEKV